MPPRFVGYYPGIRSEETHSMFDRIVIETERSGDSQSLFRLHIDDLLIREGLTVGQLQVLLREVLDRIGPPRPPTTETTAQARGRARKVRSLDKFALNAVLGGPNYELKAREEAATQPED
jgi:hypothetical protein